MYKIVPFKKEHLDCMEVRSHEDYILKTGVINSLEDGVAFTGIIDGRIIACGGVVPYKHGVGELWQIPSIYVADHALVYARYIKEWVEEMKEVFGLHRMETLCQTDELHSKWMKFIGFESEGVKKKFFDGQDYEMWGKTWE